MGGEAGDGGLGRDVGDYGGSGGYDGPLAYLYAGDYGRCGSYPGSFGDRDVGAEGWVGSTLWPG